MVRADIRELLKRLFEALDWAGLGEVYCDEGGDAFWREHRRPTRIAGLAWADALARRLRPGGRSLYVGAGVAELPAMLCERRELGREVVATNLRARECELLEAGLRAVGVAADELELRPIAAVEAAAGSRFDHLAVVSVLTDPESFPVTSAVGYGRLPPVLLDLSVFEAERQRILGLVDALLDTLEPPAVITTSVDELPWLLHVAAPRGLRVEADDETIATAVVGDPIGFLTITRADPV